MRDHKDEDKFIKDKWFDDYCFYKLVIEEKGSKPAGSSAENTGCGIVAVVLLVAFLIINELSRIF